MVEWFHLNGKQANIIKTGNLSQLCDYRVIAQQVNRSYSPIFMKSVEWNWKTHRSSTAEFCVQFQLELHNVSEIPQKTISTKQTAIILLNIKQIITQ